MIKFYYKIKFFKKLFYFFFLLKYYLQCPSGEIGKHAGLRNQCLTAWRFKSSLGYKLLKTPHRRFFYYNLCLKESLKKGVGKKINYPFNQLKNTKYPAFRNAGWKWENKQNKKILKNKKVKKVKVKNVKIKKLKS